MKKQEQKSRLVLKKETIARLNNLDLGRIYGRDGQTETISRSPDVCITHTHLTRIGVTCPKNTCNC